MGENKAFGTPVQFTPGEIVWDRLDGDGPWLVLECADGTVALYVNNESRHKQLPAVALTTQRPGLARSLQHALSAWNKKWDQVPAVIAVVVGTVSAVVVAGITCIAFGRWLL